ncbi:MAG TPA: hypothetical protein VJN69_03295 [Candidatus Acidoferrales bacterium]|nr:hypothetical protein [Candidatus Acidoferrales bacterium]
MGDNCTAERRRLDRRHNSGRDLRKRKRLKLSLGAHLRPFDPRLRDLEDIALVVDFNRDGLHFITLMLHYSVGMKLEVTFPHGRNVTSQRKYIGSVVRIDDRGDGTSAISVKFLF